MIMQSFPVSPIPSIGDYLPIRINSDLSQPVSIDTNNIKWEHSPIQGVERRKLDRIGDEIARATTIVKFEPNTQFPEHVHTGGEEFLVLNGVFTDEVSGNHPAGIYCRHPINSKHKPFSKEGCTILVKLQQMIDKSESNITYIDMNNHALYSPSPLTPTRFTLTLHTSSTGEFVWAEHILSNTQFEWIVGTGGEELFVIDGELTIIGDGAEGKLSKGYWCRRPSSYQGRKFIVKSTSGAKLWCKRGHLIMKLLNDFK